MTDILYLLAGCGMVTLGLYYAFTSVERLRQVLAVNIMGSGVFLILVTRAWGTGTDQPDPVPQALVLTGLVVAAASTGLGLALARRADEDAR